MQHVMVDIETLSTEPDAPIISIGAVKFDPNSFTIGETFYCPISISSNFEIGRKASASTLEWWMGKDNRTALDQYLEAEKEPLWTALDGFATWFGTESLPTWGNGATFDNVILSEAFKACSIPRPWSHRHDRCYRTLCALKPDMEIRREGTYHNALDDAITQAKHMQRIVQHCFTSSICVS